MTKLPLEDRSVVGSDEPLYPLNPICAVPDCLNPSEDPHHIWRRTALGGAFNWVVLPGEDAMVGNVVGLCRHHHRQVTINAAFIQWNGRGYDWSDLFTAGRPLTFQPPAKPIGEMNALVEVYPEEEGSKPSYRQYCYPQCRDPFFNECADCWKSGGNPAIGVKGEEPKVSTDSKPLDGACPTCLRPLPHSAKPSTEPKRPRRTWSVTVPSDERENGAETLTTLLEEGRKEMAKLGMPYSDDEVAKFFVLTHILAFFVQHAEELMANA